MTSGRSSPPSPPRRCAPGWPPPAGPAARPPPPRPRREAPFSFGLEPGGGGPLVTGYLDAAAVEPDGGVLIVDYKSDRLEGATAEGVVQREEGGQRIVSRL